MLNQRALRAVVIVIVRQLDTFSPQTHNTEKSIATVVAFVTIFMAKIEKGCYCPEYNQTATSRGYRTEPKTK